MLAAIDVGNTNIVLGIYRGEKLLAHWRVATDREKTADEYAVLLYNLFSFEKMAFSDIKAAAISSVVPPLTAAFEELAQRYFAVTPLLVGPGVKTGIRIALDNPREVGADRIVNALAAYRLYGGPCIILDFGTATTFDVLTAEGEYVGGAIAPGIGIAAEALVSRTAKLPRIELIMPKSAIGHSTVTSMQSGVMFGYVGLVEGLIARIRAEIGNCKVVATGGLAEVIARESKVIDVVDDKLTLHGLRMLYELNFPTAAGSRPSRQHEKRQE